MIYQSNYTSEGAAPVTITWKNWDGSILKTEQVESGSIPAYTGTPTYSNENLSGATFTFDGWTPALSAVEKDSTYTAKYNISGLPEGMSETISKSWDEIIEDAEAGNIEDYKELDTKIMICTDGKPLCYELAGRFDDTIANSDEYATMTWVPITIDGQCAWNTQNRNSIGGYPASEYKTYMEETCFQHIPDFIKEHIVEVNKVCYCYDPSTSDMAYTAKVWPLNVHELNLDGSNPASFGYLKDESETTGAVYTAYRTDEQRKRYNSSGKESYAWLSTTSNSSNIMVYTISDSGGVLNTQYVINDYGALPCFCLGKAEKPPKVTWKNLDGSIIDTTFVKKGNTPTHENPKYDIPFIGWNPSLGPIEEDTTYVAQYTLPTGMSQTIEKSWDEIILDASNGNNAEYSLLDTKMLFTTDGKALCFELAGKDVDSIAYSGSNQTASMTWISKTIYGKCQWNTDHDNRYGYPSSNYKKYLESCIENFPANVRFHMQYVNKVCYCYSPKDQNLSYQARVWPPNLREFNSTEYDISDYESVGAQYTIYTQNSQRVRYDANGKPVDAWLSSVPTYAGELSCNVTASGSWSGNGSAFEYGALPCFCLGTTKQNG